MGRRGFWLLFFFYANSDLSIKQRNKIQNKILSRELTTYTSALAQLPLTQQLKALEEKNRP